MILIFKKKDILTKYVLSVTLGLLRTSDISLCNARIIVSSLNKCTKNKKIKDSSGTIALNEHGDSFIIVLRGHVDALTQEQMMKVWEITGTFVLNIYRKVPASREGKG